MSDASIDVFNRSNDLKRGSCRDKHLDETLSAKVGFCDAGESISCGVYEHPAPPPKFYDYCSSNNYFNYEQCGTNGVGSFSFCRGDVNALPTCFQGGWCLDITQTCTSNSDCPSTHACSLNNCGTVCTILCGHDFSGVTFPYGDTYQNGECWDASYDTRRVLGSYHVLDKECVVGSPVDNMGRYRCDETGHIVAVN